MTTTLGLPTETWSLESYTIEEYEALLASINGSYAEYRSGASPRHGWQRERGQIICE